MRWQQKAALMRIFARFPYGDILYRWGQKKFGRLYSHPMARLPTQVEMTQWLVSCGMSVEGKTFFEVGTGHKPTVPIGFFLSGAAQTITVD